MTYVEKAHFLTNHFLELPLLKRNLGYRLAGIVTQKKIHRYIEREPKHGYRTLNRRKKNKKSNA